MSNSQSKTFKNPRGPLDQSLGPASISLVCMFQVLTGCCIFFACLRVSPLLAIIGTIIVAPAIIRTGLASELHRQNGIPFDWRTRIQNFLSSIGIVLISLGFSAVVFAVVSVVFSFIWVCLALSMGARDMITDIAFVGTAGGMIWGLLGAMLAMGLCASKWKPKLKEEGTTACPAKVSTC